MTSKQDKWMQEYAEKVLGTPQAHTIADILVGMGVPNKDIGKHVTRYIRNKKVVKALQGKEIK